MAEEREITITLRGQNLTQEGFEDARRQLLGLDQVARKPKAGIDGLSSSWTSLTASFLSANLIERGARALFDFGQDTLAAAGNLMDLRASTGASLEALQRWTHVAEQGGIPLEKMTDAAFKLGAKIANEPESVRGAIERLHLSFDELRAMSPEDQFNAIMQAADAVGPSQERNAILVELFGQKAAVELARVVSGYQEVYDAATAAGNGQIEALDRAADSWTKAMRDIGTAGINFFGGLLRPIYEVGAAVESLSETELAHYRALQRAGFDTQNYLIDIAIERNKAWSQGPPYIEQNTVATVDYSESLAEAQRALEGLTQKQRLEIDAAQRLGVATKDIAATVGTTSEVIKLYTERQKASADAKREAEAASKKLEAQKKKEREEMEKLLTTWSHYGRTLEPFTGLLENFDREARDHVTLVSMAREEYGRAAAAAREWAQANGAVLAPSIRQVSSVIQEEQTGTAGGFRGFLSSMFGDAESFGQGIAGIFSAAFEGGGGALGAVKSFATQGLSALLAMIPGVGPFVSAFAGPIIEMFSRLIAKSKDFFRSLFGGPSGGELNDRNLVREWEDQVIASSTNAQNETERWRQVVVAVTEAYLRNGRTAEEAERDVARAWASSREGGEETWRVLDEINRKIQEQAGTAAAWVDRVGEALEGLPDEVRVRIRGEYEEPDLPRDGGYTEGTMGRHGRWFADFGSGYQTALHGREAVVPYADRMAFARDMLASQAQPAPAAAPINIHLAFDEHGLRQLSEGQFKQIAERLRAGRLPVPQIAVVPR